MNFTYLRLFSFIPILIRYSILIGCVISSKQISENKFQINIDDQFTEEMAVDAWHKRAKKVWKGREYIGEPKITVINDSGVVPVLGVPVETVHMIHIML